MRSTYLKLPEFQEWVRFHKTLFSEQNIKDFGRKYNNSQSKKNRNITKKKKK